jgi:hypothetical protein
LYCPRYRLVALKTKLSWEQEQKLRSPALQDKLRDEIPPWRGKKCDNFPFHGTSCPASGGKQLTYIVRVIVICNIQFVNRIRKLSCYTHPDQFWFVIWRLAKSPSEPLPTHNPIFPVFLSLSLSTFKLGSAFPFTKTLTFGN